MIAYEWCFETVDDGDIIDSNFADKLSDFTDSDKTDTLCLVRNEGDEINGLEDRLWAYVKDGKLPEFFEDGRGKDVDVKVPLKFKNELSRFLKL